MNLIVRIYVYFREKALSPFLAKIEKKLKPLLFEDGAKKLKELKEKCNTVTDFEHYMERVSFRWIIDPFFGLLDFTSYPEMTIAKRTGDCDDFAELAIVLLKPHFQKVWRIYSFSKFTKGHVMALFYNGFNWQLISNTKKLLVTEDGANIFERCVEAWHGPGAIKGFYVEEIK